MDGKEWEADEKGNRWRQQKWRRKIEKDEDRYAEADVQKHYRRESQKTDGRTPETHGRTQVVRQIQPPAQKPLIGWIVT